MIWMGYVLYAVYVLTTIWLMIGTALQLHLLWHAKRKKKPSSTQPHQSFPFVTVQVPVYNEKFVIAGLLRCLQELDYPKHLFEVQVLDDSTDETRRIIDAEVARMQSKGADVSIIRRANRSGYKAGALQYGMQFLKGEFIAIFDADFRPGPAFLKTLLPAFADASVGMVQAKWTHQNPDENFLTRIQTYLLDLHFGVEQEGRGSAGYFTNFCGTAGIWRKRCIEDAGGWDGTVLSEDLDLSYRAQLKGWRAVYQQSFEVPAQLPAQMEAFKVQQFRWNKGMAQTARKSLRRVFGARTTAAKKVHGLFHLLGSFTFVCLFVNAALTVPLLHLRHLSPAFFRLTSYTILGAVNLLAIVFLYYKSATENEKNLRSFLKDYSLFALVYLALSVQNTVAVLQGFAGVHSPFVRTPKFASSAVQTDYKAGTDKKIFFLETATFLYFLYGVCLSFYKGDCLFIGIQLLFCCGLGILLFPVLSTLYFLRRTNAGALKTVSPVN